MIRPSARAQSVQLPIIPQVADWIRQHPGTLSLGQGVAGYAPPREAWEEVERIREDPQWNKYQPVSGLPELLSAVGGKLARRNGVSLNSERALMITTGANAAFLQVVLALCDPGDEVLLPLPYYFNQEMALALAHVRARCVPVDARFQPDPDALLEAVTPRTRAIVTISPNNPGGAVYGEAVLRRINTICGERGLIHLSDETYEDFVFDGARHVSPGAFPGAEGHTISLHSFSKAYGLAGWRVGYAVFPAALLESLRKIQDTHVICPPVISQWAALGCLRAGDAWLAERRNELAQTRRVVLDGLRELVGVAELGPADGAFYVLVRLGTGWDAVELTRRLIAEHRVAVLPGTAFGWDRECVLRVAYGALTPESAAEGVGRLVRGVRELISR